MKRACDCFAGNTRTMRWDFHQIWPGTLHTKRAFSPIFIDELERLQHRVKPLSEEQVKQILERSLPQSMGEIFSQFQMEPIAAASIGQVHKARLKDYEEVVVKLLRPEVKGIMRDDLEILEEFANWLSTKSTWAESLGFRELAGDLQMDYVRRFI